MRLHGKRLHPHVPARKVREPKARLVRALPRGPQQPRSRAAAADGRCLRRLPAVRGDILGARRQPALHALPQRALPATRWHRARRRLRGVRRWTVVSAGAALCGVRRWALGGPAWPGHALVQRRVPKGQACAARRAVLRGMLPRYLRSAARPEILPGLPGGEAGAPPRGRRLLCVSGRALQRCHRQARGRALHGMPARQICTVQLHWQCKLHGMPHRANDGGAAAAAR